MKKIIYSIMAVCVLSLGVCGSVEAVGQNTEQKVNLTAEQKAELGKLHDQMFATKKELVKKYVEYGVFSKEQGDKVLAMMEEKHKKLKENGYMMRWHPHHGKKLDMKE
ncbi:DUF2680 domain-containing protein [Bacillus sp. KH172YL63]|uniref:DUF2680 domain-containing protein n=1 Tax=Bacillus sp. KH172YL63 TaxID=2709784 RepID=UPI0013E45421|nr:DUF2680 domain-containing protein [Bacillus sp. KH172YL63]BCB03876.1 hypothetical protein KH172YL63_20090 [Bacillus sp. KH172YL63]